MPLRRRGRLLAVFLTVMMCGCAANQEVKDPWVNDEFAEAPEQVSSEEAGVPQDEDFGTAADDDDSWDTGEPAKAPKKQRRAYSESDEEGWSALTRSYPTGIMVPPGIAARQKAWDRKIPYGSTPYLDQVPLKGTPPFPQDYAGVQRWNRLLALPNDAEVIIPPKSSYTFPVDEDPVPVQVAKGVGGVAETVSAVNEEVYTFSAGPQGTFALNFLDDLRGGSFSLGLGGLLVRNRTFTFDGWIGYRRIVAGVSGENKEVYTLDNLALGVAYGMLPYVEGPRHLRVMLGFEFDYNFTTNRSLAGGGSESFADIHVPFGTFSVNWHDGDWGLFTKYNLGFRQIADDHAAFLHVLEFGFIAYLL